MMVYQLKRCCNSRRKVIATSDQVRTSKNALMSCIKLLFCV